mgnify:CR=1 FL=1
MARRPTYATRQFTVPAGGSVEVYRDADFVTALEANVPFVMSMDNAPRVDFEQGLTLRTVEGFTRVEVKNESAETLTVKLGFGKGDIQDSRLTLGGTVQTQEKSPDTFTTGAQVSAADGAATALVAANADRAEVVIANDGAGKVYIAGDVGAGAAEGIPVDAGGVLVLTTSAALWARNDSGGAVAVSVAEVERA